MNLEKEIKLCIPSLVIEEMKQHYLSLYEESVKNTKTLLSDIKQCFGKLIDINYTFNIESKREYKKFIEISIENLINKKDFEVVHYPEILTSEFIRKALTSTQPFSKAKNNGKLYSDAGFKDAIIIETIIQNSNDNDKIIFFTKDSDFKISNKKNFQIINEYENIIKKLKEQFWEEIVRHKISNDYFVKRLLEELKINFKNFLEELKINIISCTINILLSEEDTDENINNINEFDINQIIEINNIKYKISYIYNSTSNDFDIIGSEKIE